MIDEEQRALDEKKIWESWLGTTLGLRLSGIRDAVRRQIRTHGSQPLRGFTPHDATHCQAVEDFIHRLIPGERYRQLREYERYLLLASAWTHDLGMLRDLPLGGHEPIDDARIRATHHERSEKFIVDCFREFGDDPAVERDAPILGLLSMLHGVSLKNAPEEATIGAEQVRVRLLAAYLSLADALHIDASRAPADAYAICLAYDVPTATKIHWIKSRFVEGVRVDADAKKITLQLKRPAERQTRDLLEKGVTPAGIARLHEQIHREVERNVMAVSDILSLGGISVFCSVGIESVPMLLDRQVLQDLRHAVNNLGFMANPSSSRLTQLLLRTVSDILGCNEHGEDAGEPLSEVEKRRRLDQVLDVMKRIEESVLVERPCHLGLRTQVESIRQRLVEAETQLGDGSPPDGVDDGWESLLAEIRERIDTHEEIRRKIRVVAREYLVHQLRTTRGWDLDKEPSATGDLISEARPITIVLFGHSEHVVKALCGFRDAVLRWLLRLYERNGSGWGLTPTEAKDEKPPRKSLVLPFHAADLERLASDLFRLFVCTTEPKRQVSDSPGLSYDDAFQYAKALGEHGFTDVLVIPDAIVSNLLNRGVNDASTFMPHGEERGLVRPMVDLVLVGANGILDDCFLQAGGHLGIAIAVSALRAIYSENRRFSYLPRLVVVAGKGKRPSHPRSADKKHDTDIERWSYLDRKAEAKNPIVEEGCRIRRGYAGESVRKKSFVRWDPSDLDELAETELRLYCPREDSVWFSLVDDFIWEDGWFRGGDPGLVRPEEGRDGMAFTIRGWSREKLEYAGEKKELRDVVRSFDSGNGCPEEPGPTAQRTGEQPADRPTPTCPPSTEPCIST